MCFILLPKMTGLYLRHTFVCIDLRILSMKQFKTCFMPIFRQRGAELFIKAGNVNILSIFQILTYISLSYSLI